LPESNKQREALGLARPPGWPPQARAKTNAVGKEGYADTSWNATASLYGVNLELAARDPAREPSGSTDGLLGKIEGCTTLSEIP
jgi:hypothetical protein